MPYSSQLAFEVDGYVCVCEHLLLKFAYSWCVKILQFMDVQQFVDEHLGLCVVLQ